jgi:bacterioferritin-associated ferredoxin
MHVCVCKGISSYGKRDEIKKSKVKRKERKNKKRQKET